MVMGHARKVGGIAAVRIAGDAAATQQVRRRRPYGGAIGHSHSVHVVRLSLYRLGCVSGVGVHVFVLSIQWLFMKKYIFGGNGGLFCKLVGEEKRELESSVILRKNSDLEH